MARTAFSRRRRGNRQMLRIHTGKTALSLSSGTAIWNMFNPATASSAEIIKNLQVLVMAKTSSSGNGLFEHGFIRYPAGEAISIGDVDTASRYVLRTKVVPWVNSTTSPFLVISNYLNAVTLTPDDTLSYYVKQLDGDWSSEQLMVAWKYAGATRGY